MLIALLALPSYVAPVALLPLVAVLVQKGLSPGLALFALVLGPALDRDTFVFLAKRYGRGSAVLVFAVTLGVTAGLSILTSRFVVIESALTPAAGPVAVGAACVLGALLAHRVWESGFRGFLGAMSSETVRHSHADKDAAEAHGHVH